MCFCPSAERDCSCRSCSFQASQESAALALRTAKRTANGPFSRSWRQAVCRTRPAETETAARTKSRVRPSVTRWEACWPWERWSPRGVPATSAQSAFLAALPVEGAFSVFFSEPLPFEESVLAVSFESVFEDLLL